MSKIKLSIIALSCVMALSACSSSSKGGTDNTDQIRQLENELNQKIAEANKKAEAAVKKAEEAAKANSQKQTDTEKSTAQEALKKAEEAAKAALANNQKTEAEKNAAQEALKKAEEAAKAAQASSQKTEAEKKAAQEALKKAEEAAKAAQANNQKTEAEKNAAQEALKKAEEAAKAAQASSQKTEAEKKAAEERLKKLESLQADEKARIPLSDKVFGGISGEMKDTISGGTINLKKNELNSVLTANIRELTIRDEDGRLADINILRTAGEIDPESYEAYDEPYNLRKEGQTILSNNNFQASAFGTYFDRLSGNQYFFAQGNPTALAQIPTAGRVEYNGGAVYKKDGDRNYSERTEMTATADFGTKAIDIKIKEKTNAVPAMNFGGKITGNSFAGEVNGIKTQGGFFGENAREMTGLFTNEADKSRGAFGGIKQ